MTQQPILQLFTYISPDSLSPNQGEKIPDTGTDSPQAKGQPGDNFLCGMFPLWNVGIYFQVT